MKKIALYLLGIILYLTQFTLVSAQSVCAPTRIVNQFACVPYSSQGACTRSEFACSGNLSHKGCTGSGGFNPCGPGEGTCIEICLEFAQSLFDRCIQTGTQTVACSSAPQCQAIASPTACSGGGSASSPCTETSPTLTFGCWVNSGGGGSNGGGGGSCPSCQSLADTPNNCGEVGMDPASGTCGAGERCCQPKSTGPTCNGTATVCQNDSDCAVCGAGQCCNSPGGGVFGNCRYYTNIYAVKCVPAGATDPAATYYCGQQFQCDGTKYCPSTQAIKMEAAPTGLTPADNATVTPGLTCNAACTSTIDCGGHWIEGTMMRNGGLASKYRNVFFDAAIPDQGAVVTENNISRTRLGWGPSANVQFNGGRARVATTEHQAFWFPVIGSSTQILTYKNNTTAYLKIAVDGKDAATYPLNSIDIPPITFQYPIPVTTTPERGYVCQTGVCRMKTNPTDATCTDIVTPAGSRAPFDSAEKSILLSWNPQSPYQRWNLELYPTGTGCSDPRAFCGRVVRPNYRFIPAPGVSQYKWRVSVINDLCVAYPALTPNVPVNGAWSPLYTLNINSNVDLPGTVVEDTSGTASIVGVACQGGTPTTYTTGGTVALTGNGQNKSAVVSAAGTYTLTAVPGNTNYTMTFTPADASYTCSCPAGCSYTGTVSAPLATPMPFFVTKIQDPWYQTQGGDILVAGSGNTVTNPIPQTTCVAPDCDPYLSLPAIANRADTAGSLAVSSGAVVDLTVNTTGPQSANVCSGTSRLARLQTIPNNPQSYDYFKRLYSLPIAPANDFGAGTGAGKPCSGAMCNRDYYYQGGNLTIDQDWNVNPAEKIVVFVAGNLTIQSEIKVAKGGFVGFIVKGDITITQDVGTLTLTQKTNGQIQGMYLADGTIRIATCGNTGTEKKFIGEGTFAGATGISIKRDYRNGHTGLENNQYPVALFVYRPDLVLNAPERIKTPLGTWKETNPQ